MEIYPGSTCSLSDSGIHHCREGILIKVSPPLRAVPVGAGASCWEKRDGAWVSGLQTPGGAGL